MGLLEDILKNKKKEVKRDSRLFPLQMLDINIQKSNLPSLDLVFPAGKTNIIGEIKQKSPSGFIFEERGYDDRAIEIGKIYAKHCSAISVLTDNKYFGGCGSHLSHIKENVNLPVLRKDFILPGRLGEYQIHESRFYGADFILLIARILERGDIENSIKLAKYYGMKCIVEVDSERGLGKAVDAGAEIIGINNRNLDTLECDLRRSIELAPLIPKDRYFGVESGIRNRADIDLLHDNGVFPNLLLVGTNILTSDDIESKLRELKGE